MINTVDSDGDGTDSASPNYDGLYGQLITKETPELLSSSLTDLDTALENIIDTEKTAWTTALEKCPSLCGEPFKLMFLRCTHFDCDRAAKRIVAYWTKRLELFTPSKAFLPMILGPDGAMKDDEVALNVGFICLIQKSDDLGHPLLFFDASRLPEEKDRISMVRVFWYHIHAALESENGQRQGFVIISYPKNAKIWQFDRYMLRLIIQSVRGCLPVRISAIHTCHPPIFFRLVFPIIKMLMGEKLRKRMKVHIGDEEKILEKLERKYRIPQQNLPNELGGGIVLKQEEWLQGRLEAGL